MQDRAFVMGDRGVIPNLGQKVSSFFDVSARRDLSSILQIAAVTRRLRSVGNIGDEDREINFNAAFFVIIHCHWL